MSFQNLLPDEWQFFKRKVPNIQIKQPRHRPGLFYKLTFKGAIISVELSPRHLMADPVLLPGFLM